MDINGFIFLGLCNTQKSREKWEKVGEVMKVSVDNLTLVGNLVVSKFHKVR